MNDIEKTIAYFKNCVVVTARGNDSNLTRKITIQALEEKLERENQQPLTLDELRQMNGQPIWIRDLMDGEVECLRFDCIKPATYHTGDDCRFEQFGTSTGIIRWECKYGETWLAYRYPPKEATHAAESNS